MKKVLGLLSILSIMSITGVCFAGGVGYVDYGYISKNYPLAQKYNSSLKTKAQNIKTYAQNQDAKIQKAQTKAEKEKLSKEGITQVEAKQKELNTLRVQYESELSGKVASASEKIRVKKGLDIIIKKNSRITGGVDCTTEVLNILKAQ